MVIKLASNLQNMIQTFIIIKNVDSAVHSTLSVRGVKTNRDGLITFVNGILSGVEGDAVSFRGGAKAERSKSREIMV